MRILVQRVKRASVTIDGKVFSNRPSYIRAARLEKAIPLYEEFISLTESLLGRKVMTGSFGAMMDVELVNDGPVTIFIDSKIRE